MVGRSSEASPVNILEPQVRTRTQSTQCGATNTQPDIQPDTQPDTQPDADIELDRYTA